MQDVQTGHKDVSVSGQPQADLSKTQYSSVKVPACGHPVK